MQDNFDEIDDNKGGAKQPFVPFEKAWAALQPQLDKEAARRKRKRRFLFFWLSFIAIALIGGLALMRNGRPVAHSYTKIGVNTNAKPSAPIIAVPLIVTKSLFKKYSSIDKNKNLAGVDSIKKRVNPYPKIEVVASSTASSYAKLEKNKIIKTKNEGVDIKKDVLEENKDLVMKDPKKKEENVALTNTANDSTKNKETDSTKKAVTVTDKKKQKTEKKSRFHFGLQFDLPLHSGVNSLDVNGNKEPLSYLLPTAWASIQIAQKQDLLLLINPYSQYYLNDRIRLINNQYQASVQTESSINNAPQETNYTQLTTINKLIGVQASLVYQYQLSNKLKIGFGLGTNFLQGALLENRIIKNNLKITHDSLYGIDKQGSEWNLMRKNFFSARLEGVYQLKKIEVGASINQVIGGVTTNKTNTAPSFNSNIFIRWKIR